MKRSLDMIYTITLNPAYDKTYKVSSFEEGKTNRVQSVNTTVGGKGLNISRILSSLNTPNLALGIADSIFVDFIASEGIKNDFTIITNPVRINIKILNTSKNIITELNEAGADVTEANIDEFKNNLVKYISGGDIAIFSGSLPPGVPYSFYRELIELCNKKSVISILDTSGAALKEGIKAKPFMIKPNIDELSYLTGKYLSSVSEIQTEALKIASCGIDKVMVSMGKDGAVLASGKDVYYKKAPEVPVHSTVGAGDAMLAAFVAGMTKSPDDKELLTKAIDMGSKSVMGKIG